MSRPKRRSKKHVNVEAIPGILDALDSLVEAFDDESLDDEALEDIGYQLDALTTMFLKVGLVSRRNLRRLKFHVVIEALVVPLPDRDDLSEDMETFEDLISAYGDEPSEDEINEAKEILGEVIRALKAAFQNETNKDQLALDLNQ